MIKANELRIGNWIESAGKQRKQATAETISDLQNRSIVLSPILLTIDILEKSGFKMDRLYKYRYAIDSFVVNHTFDKQYKDCWSLALDYGQQLSTETHYVHQLQNLYFALTGTELNINL